MEGAIDADRLRDYFRVVPFRRSITPDLKKISVLTLVMHGDDDQIVPYADDDQ
jgi:hypothetical protein